MNLDIGYKTLWLCLCLIFPQLIPVSFAQLRNKAIDGHLNDTLSLDPLLVMGKLSNGFIIPL